MNTHETYISLEVAKLLKEAGFDWETSTYYQGHTSNELINTYPSCCNFNGKDSYYNTHEDVSMHRTSAPTLYVAQKWLREVKGINIQIQSCFDSVNCQYNVVVGYDYFIHRIDGKMTILPSDTHYQSYEKSLEAGIKKWLEIFLQEEQS
jgi:hypothetical protein